MQLLPLGDGGGLGLSLLGTVLVLGNLDSLLALVLRVVGDVLDQRVDQSVLKVKII